MWRTAVAGISVRPKKAFVVEQYLFLRARGLEPAYLHRPSDVSGSRFVSMAIDNGCNRNDVSFVRTNLGR